MCTEGVFNSLTGEYTFNQTDMRLFPPGTYSFSVTGLLNGVSSYVTYNLTMIDPCTLAVLTPNVATFNALNTYALGEDDQSYPWMRSTISTINTANCGSHTVSFFADSIQIPV